MDVGPIPVTAMYAWCEFNDLDSESARIMVKALRLADNDWAERRASERRLKALKGGR